MTPLALALCNNTTPVEVIKELCKLKASLNSIYTENNDNIFHILVDGGNEAIKYFKPLLTHTRFDSDNESSKVVYFALLTLNRWEQNFNKEKNNQLYVRLPENIKLRILSELLSSDLYPYKKLCKKLLQNDYNHILLPQIYERVENIKQILSSPNYENKTALQYALERFAGNPEYLKKACPLLDGTVLEIDFEHFLAHFPDIVNSPLESDKDNLVRQMFDNCAQLFLEG